jgi:hypothetical protein
MTDKSSTTLLNQLRTARPATDWRRDSPHPGLPVWLEASAAERAAGRFSAMESMEAEALLSRLALDPLPTLLGLLQLQEASLLPPPSTYRMIQELVLHWGEAMASLKTRGGPEAAKNCQQEASKALRQFAQRHPQDEKAQLALVIFIQTSAGAMAALNHIATMNEPPPALTSEYFNIIIDRMLRRPTGEIVRHAFLEPLPFRAPISLDMLRFRFHRSIVVEALTWNRSFGTSLGDATLWSALDSLPKQDPAAELDGIFRLLPLLPLDDQAQAVIGLMSCQAIWRSPAAESSRRRLLDEAMLLVPDVRDQGIMTSLMARLIDYAPQSIAYWDDPVWPRRLHELARALSPRIRPAQRHYFNGLTAFPLQDLDRVADEYKLATKAEPTASRFTSYLDPRLVGSGSHAEILNASGFECDIPEVMDAEEGEFVVVTSADEKYFRRYAFSYAKSLRSVGYRQRLHFHIIGRPEALAEDIRRVREALPESQITLSSEPVLTNRSFYYASARFMRMKDLIRRFRCSILVTDIDVSWHTRPDLWIAPLGDADIGLRIFASVKYYVMHGTGEVILRFPRTKLWECTSASSIFVRWNEAGLRFADLLAAVTSQHLQSFLDKPGTHWFIDQNILSAVYAHVLRHDPVIQIGNLDKVGTPYGPYGMITDERLNQSYGSHWIAQKEPFPPFARSFSGPDIFEDIITQPEA